MENKESDVNKKLDTMLSKMDALNAEVIRLRVITETHRESNIKNTQDIEILKADNNAMKGVINFMRFVVSLCGTAVIGFLIWLVTSYIDTQQKLTDTSHRIEMLEQHYPRNR